MLPAIFAILITIGVIAIVLMAIVMAVVVKIAFLCLVGWVIYRAFFKPRTEYSYQVLSPVAAMPRKRRRQGFNFIQFGLGLAIGLYLVGGVRQWNTLSNDEFLVAQIQEGVISESVRNRIRTAAEKGRDAINEIKSTISQKRTRNANQDKTDMVERTVTLKSAPCATEEKAKSEFNDQLRELIRRETLPAGAVNMAVVEQALKLLAIKPSITTDYKEVAGEKYPVYSAVYELKLGDDFQKKLEKAMRMNIMADARGRVNLLFDISVVVFIGLGLSNLLLRRRVSPEMV